MWKGPGRPDRRRALFGGQKTVAVWSLTDALPPAFEAVLGCELSPGGSVGAHAQEHSDEVVIVTEGKGLARVDGQPVKLAPGAVVSLRKGQILELVNRSRVQPLRYLIVKALTARRS